MDRQENEVQALRHSAEKQWSWVLIPACPCSFLHDPTQDGRHGRSNVVVKWEVGGQRAGFCFMEEPVETCKNGIYESRIISRLLREKVPLDK